MGNNPKPKKGLLSQLFSKNAAWPIAVVRGLILGTAFAYAATTFGPQLIPGRPLNNEEITSYKAFYGDSVDLSKVKVHHSKLGDHFLKFAGATAVTMNNTIIVPESIEKGHYDESDKYVMVHELGHVWQHQHDAMLAPKVIWQRIMQVGSGNGRESLYEYRLEKGKPFSSYGAEQQASILADYYNLNKNGRRPFLLMTDGQYIPTKELKQEYRTVLKDIIPLKPQNSDSTAKPSFRGV